MTRVRKAASIRSVLAAAIALAVGGCAGGSGTTAQTTAGGAAKEGHADEVAAERAKLSPEDRALVEAQEWCVVTSDERLGAMGPPIKLEVKGQPVFICCSGCKRKALADPDKTLRKVEELKAKAKAEKNAQEGSR